ncbi:MAG TPA: 2-oxoacid:acceptor oxidoreductase family protein [Syntrophorhabdaceae bacterium]|nr:2-oxoacid:acceptor oxidoreductase family protein [Syntrophorhabdaceae bacterium]HPU29343.1 2-oxoacid:acceptor oxidoreductase family protein [Syntrophorhabdaceae bacterium]
MEKIDMGFRYDIRLSGSGGQGIILMGIILAEAVGIYEGRYVSQTQSYGPEARGGSSKAEIVISDTEIDYPKAIKLDMLLAMNQKSCDDYYMDLKPEGILIVDSTFVKQLPVARVYQIPFTRIARERFGKEMVANIIALGAITKLTDIVSPKSMEKAVLARVPKGTEKLNREALNVGMAEAIKAKKNILPFMRSEREDEDT